MSDEELIEKLKLRVGEVLWNASNYPAKVTPHMLGQDIAPLREKVVSAALAVFREHTQTDTQVEDEHKSGHTAARARVVPNDPVTSACASGYCPSGCSHKMWKCDTCQCEGGWGAPVGRLEDFAAEHVCPEDTAPADAIEQNSEGNET